MPLTTAKLLLKKGKKYEVATKSLFVLPVQLLDSSLMECTMNDDGNGVDLLLHVAQRLGIPDSEIHYFGIKFINKHLQYQWLSLDLPLKRQLTKFAHDLFVKFSVRFYVRNVHQLKDEATRYQFFLQLRNEIIEGALLCSPEQAVLLAAYSLQAAYGDFDPMQHSPQHLKEFFLLPKRMCVQEEILKDLLIQVADMHRSLQGMYPGMAETYYIIEAQNLEGYGEEYYAAKDASGNDLLLGTSHAGLAIKHPTGRPLLALSWSELKSVTRAKRSSIRLECAGSGRAAQRNVQIFLENADFAEYVLSNITLQQTFYLTTNDHHVTGVDQNQLPRPPLQHLRNGAGLNGAEMTNGQFSNNRPDVVNFRPPPASVSRSFSSEQFPLPSHHRVPSYNPSNDGPSYLATKPGALDMRRPPHSQQAQTQPQQRFSWVSHEQPAEKMRKIQQQVAFNIVNSTPELRFNGFTSQPHQAVGLSSSTPDLLHFSAPLGIRYMMNQLDRNKDLGTHMKPALAQGDLSGLSPQKLYSDHFPALSEEEDHTSDGTRSTPSRDKTPSRPLLHAAMNGLVLSDRLVDNPTATIPRHKEQPADTLRTELEKRLTSGNLLIEFEQIPKKRRREDVFRVAMLPENQPRNRYPDVLPYDDTRIVLANPGKKNTEGYINASKITLKCETVERMYIAAQEPVENTMEDFMNMLWQENAKFVVALSDIESSSWLKELESDKELHHGPFVLKNDSSNSSKSGQEYLTTAVWLSNRSTKPSQRRKIYIFRLAHWSDKGIPESETAFRQMTQDIQSFRLQFQAQPSEPLVVFCRTGTGRSGMMILFDFMTQCLDHNQHVDVPRVLAHIRMQRVYMVQTFSQYRFVYAALVHHLQSARLI